MNISTSLKIPQLIYHSERCSERVHFYYFFTVGCIYSNILYTNLRGLFYDTCLHMCVYRLVLNEEYYTNVGRNVRRNVVTVLSDRAPPRLQRQWIRPCHVYKITIWQVVCVQLSCKEGCFFPLSLVVRKMYTSPVTLNTQFRNEDEANERVAAEY